MMKKSTCPILFVVALCYCFSIHGQSTFQSSIGEAGIEKGTAIISTPDNGFMLVGETCSNTQRIANAMLVKFDNNGQMTWAKTYGTASDRENFNDIKSTADNGYISVGERYPANPLGRGEVGALLKTDALGNIQWWKEFDHKGNEAEGFSIQICKDQGFVIAGMMKDLVDVSDPFFTLKSERQHIYVMKTDKNGNSQWAGYISGKYSSKALFIQQTLDQGYIITGHVYQSSGDDNNAKICLLKLGKDGNMQWIKVYDNEGKMQETGMAVYQTSDAGFVICGSTLDAGQGESDIFLLKTNSMGDLIWAKTYGGKKMDYAKSMQRVDEGFIITGSTNSYGAGSEDVFLLRVDDKGNVQWFKTYGSAYFEMALCVSTAMDGFVITGFNIVPGTADALFIKTDTNGNAPCSGSSTIIQSSFPLWAIKNEGIKWELEKGVGSLKLANQNSLGAAPANIKQKQQNCSH